jgi:hypothetical protein
VPRSRRRSGAWSVYCAGEGRGRTGVALLRGGGRCAGRLALYGGKPAPTRAARASRCCVATPSRIPTQSRHRVRAAQLAGGYRRGGSLSPLTRRPKRAAAPRPRSAPVASGAVALPRSRRRSELWTSTAPVRGRGEPVWSFSTGVGGVRGAGRLCPPYDGKPSPTRAGARRPLLCCDSVSDSEAKSPQSARRRGRRRIPTGRVALLPHPPPQARRASLEAACFAADDALGSAQARVRRAAGRAKTRAKSSASAAARSRCRR